MVLCGEKSKESLVKRIQKEITEDVLNKYWQGNQLVPFALYDDEKIYLANHSSPPADFHKVENIHVGPWRKEFHANTLINFEGEEMGILSLDHFTPTSSYESIYSIIVHEMFHAYQGKTGFLNKVTSKYNEFMFMEYPFTKENIALRVIERQELLKAVFSHDKNQKENHIGKFIGAREKRAGLIGEFIHYELGLESMEGTATYVEYQAYLDKTSLPEQFILSKFGQNLASYPDNFNSFRHSCYNAGMFICLILDQYNLDWQEEFMNSGKLLYEFFLEKILVIKKDIEVKDLTVAEYLADTEKNRRQDSIDNFLSSKGYKIVLNGTMGLASFNPMQVVPNKNQILHQTLLGVNNNSTTIFIKGQSLSTQINKPWELKEIVFFRDEKPIVHGDVIHVKDVGEIKGSLEINNGTYFIQI